MWVKGVYVNTDSLYNSKPFQANAINCLSGLGFILDRSHFFAPIPRSVVSVHLFLRESRVKSVWTEPVLCLHGIMAGLFIMSISTLPHAPSQPFYFVLLLHMRVCAAGYSAGKALDVVCITSDARVCEWDHDAEPIKTECMLRASFILAV